MMVRLCVLTLCSLMLSSCAPRQAGTTDPLALPTGEDFQAYWYHHGAEISRYRLQQARYGHLHEGDAVLIFVTEPFDPAAQVKYEGNQPEKDGAVPVLKLNATRNFLTGIYPYSMMSSIFTPIDSTATLKVTTSSQEWCGHTFTQFNRREEGWRLQLFSYFQGEGDQDRMLPDAPHEAGIWTRIRLAPDELPTGEFEMIPDPVYQRLSHTEIKPYQARASLSDSAEQGPHGEALRTYTITYPQLNRSLSIHFHRDFPHVIEGWQESRDSFGKQLTTTATRTHSQMLPYWSQHNPDDRQRRHDLGLPTD